MPKFECSSTNSIVHTILKDILLVSSSKTSPPPEQTEGCTKSRSFRLRSLYTFGTDHWYQSVSSITSHTCFFSVNNRKCVKLVQSTKDSSISRGKRDCNVGLSMRPNFLIFYRDSIQTVTYSIRDEGKYVHTDVRAQTFEGG